MALPAGDRELVQIMDAALADAARRAGPWLVCRPGCTQCCHGAFAINELDARRIGSGMENLRTENPNLAADLQRRAHIWLYEHGPTFPGDPQTGRLGETEADQARFEDYANQAPCPALNPATGLCDIYEWRPMTCRVFGPPVRVETDSSDLDSPWPLRTMLQRRNYRRNRCLRNAGPSRPRTRASRPNPRAQAKPS